MLLRPVKIRKVVIMSERLLSIGMIVKNEIRCLEKCLKALEPLRQAVPSELVIADTGSNDGTQEIAARYADIYFEFPWQDDFAAARNAVLSRCTGKWYLSVDADEYLDDNIEDLVEFLRMPETPAKYGMITISNYKDSTLSKDSVISFLSPRLARRTPGLCFEGKVHERFNLSPDDPMYDLSTVILWHDGYAFDTRIQARSKMERNMRLLQEELEKSPEDPLRIVQCIESSRNSQEKLKYIQRGLALIRSGAPGWEQQGASLLRSAIDLGVCTGIPEVQEWIDLAFKYYADSALIKIDINAISCEFYNRSLQWKLCLKAADAYWEGIQQLDQGKLRIDEFATATLNCASDISREKIALYQADACYNLNRSELAMQVLDKIPLCTVCDLNIADLVGLLAKLTEKIDVAKYFCADARQILQDEPSTQEEWRRRDALRQALTGLFLPSNQYQLPVKLLQGIEDDSFAPAAAIMASTDTAEIERIAQSIKSWKGIPFLAIQKIMESGIQFPDALFCTMDFEDICGISEFLAGDMDNVGKQFLGFINKLEASDARMATWRMELLIQACACFQWKNTELSEQLLVTLCKATETFLTTVYSMEVLQSEYVHAILPQRYRFAYGCVRAEAQLQADNAATCVHILKDLVNLAPNMRDMILFMTERAKRVTEERRMRAGITPELIAMAKQVRAMLAQYPENSPMVFMLKSSEQYQKMKFLIEDPNLGNM